MPSKTKQGLSKVASKDSFQRQLLSIMPYMDVDAIVQIMLQSGNIDQVIPREEESETEYPKTAVEFVTQVLGYQMWDKLEEICNSVESNHNTLVSSGYGVGKSFLSAGLACYWLSTKKPAAVITLAPVWNQVQNILWRYIRQVGRRANLPGQILDTPRWEVTPEVYGYGISPKKTSDSDMASLQGRHSPNQLVIMDEAAGLDKRVWDTVQGLAVASDNRVLAIGNPSDMTSVFYEKQLSPNWNTIHVSCFDHPNVETKSEVIPGAVSYEWVQERIKEWTLPADPYSDDAFEYEGYWYKPLPIFTAKVLGRTPQVSDDQLINFSWIIGAQKNVEGQSGEIVIGLDPARSGGDDSAMCIRNGFIVESISRRKNMDSNKLAAWLQQVCNEREVSKIFVDEIGIGAGTVDAARKIGLPVFGVIFSRNASEKKRFVNLRSQCWWNLREILRLGKLQLPQDPILEADLSSVKYGYDTYGRIELESKDEIRSRLGRSPDSGDALSLTFSLPWQDQNYNSQSFSELDAENSEIWKPRWTLVPKRIGSSRWRT